MLLRRSAASPGPAQQRRRFRDSADRIGQARSERPLAGPEHRQLRHPGARGAAGHGDAARARSCPCPPRKCSRSAPSARCPPASASSMGDELPYLPAALEQKKKNQESWLTLDPEIKCYLPGVPRATYMPFPFQIFQSDSAFFIAYEYAGAVRNIYLKDPGTAAGRLLDGPVVGPVGRRHVRHRFERLQRSDVVRSRRQLPQRADDGDRALHDDRSRPHPVPRPRSPTRRPSRGRGRCGCRSTAT